MARKPDLGTGELEVLKALWDRGPCTVREALDALQGRGHELAYNTVQTVLTRLVDKGFATRDTRQKSHLFRAKVTRHQLSRKRLRELLQNVNDGMAGSMVLQLVRTGSLTENDVSELQQLLDGLAEKGRKKGR